MFSTKIIKVCCSLFIIYWKQAAPAAADRCYVQPSAYTAPLTLVNDISHTQDIKIFHIGFYSIPFM